MGEDGVPVSVNYTNGMGQSYSGDGSEQRDLPVLDVYIISLVVTASKPEAKLTISACNGHWVDKGVVCDGISLRNQARKT